MDVSSFCKLMKINVFLFSQQLPMCQLNDVHIKMEVFIFYFSGNVLFWDFWMAWCFLFVWCLQFHFL